MASKGTLFGRNPGSVIKRPGAETERAKKNGRSLHAQAEIDAHRTGTTKRDKRIRSEGAFALASQRGSLQKAKELDHRVGKRKALAKHDRRVHRHTTKRATRRESGRR